MMFPGNWSGLMYGDPTGNLGTDMFSMLTPQTPYMMNGSQLMPVGISTSFSPYAKMNETLEELRENNRQKDRELKELNNQVDELRTQFNDQQSASNTNSIESFMNATAAVLTEVAKHLPDRKQQKTATTHSNRPALPGPPGNRH